ncbi:hypothetical protein H072_7766 [Dactylellina haptotyla CBS 200.50]|uniref:Uncharacterized protein n=1 Tax=Dactylellina haptotyla (strain CBS 200.50) TaxID=1284197 RepID=S8A6L8_DACHA|nr:hypothetical protein H072_7766 [Dactylellina haptotyla CBS 200.50]
MFVSSVFVFWALTLGVRGVAIPEPEVVEEIGNFMQITKRTNELGHETLELGLHRRHPAMQETSLEKRDFKVLEPLDPVHNKDDETELRQFGEEFVTQCATTNNVMCVPEEMYGAAEALLDRKGSYEFVTGWSGAGMVSIGNAPNEPKKYAKCTPIQCAAATGRAKVELCSAPNKPFTTGYSMDRQLIARALALMIKWCQWEAKNNAVTEFVFYPKDIRFENMRVVGSFDDCSTWTKDICSSVDDKSKSQCLALKSLWGVPWTTPQPTKTTPARRKRQENKLHSAKVIEGI